MQPLVPCIKVFCPSTPNLTFHLLYEVHTLFTEMVLDVVTKWDKYILNSYINPLDTELHLVLYQWSLISVLMVHGLCFPWFVSIQLFFWPKHLFGLLGNLVVVSCCLKQTTCQTAMWLNYGWVLQLIKPFVFDFAPLYLCYYCFCYCYYFKNHGCVN